MHCSMLYYISLIQAIHFNYKLDYLSNVCVSETEHMLLDYRINTVCTTTNRHGIVHC
jgi:hypothetical protein